MAERATERPRRARGGRPLAPSVARPIERSLGVDVSGVRVHTGPSAEGAARAVGARAFAYGPDVFLGPGERPADLAVMAHEVAHVVQQSGAPALQRHSAGTADPLEREAHSAAGAVARGERFAVQGRTAPRVQGLGVSDALDYFADKANLIPGFRMFTIVLGVNPINMSRVDRSAANILRALVEFIPGGGLLVQALDNHGVFERAGAWIEQQLNSLGLTGRSIREAVGRFIDSLSWSDIFDLGGVWERAKRIFTEPIRRIIDFAGRLVGEVVRMVKEAILRPLARLAEGTRGYDLLKAVLGYDPITGEAVPRTAETLIGGFMKLIGQEEVWENIKRGRAIPRAWAWFQGVLAGVLAFVRGIPQLFVSALQQLELADILLIPRAFARVARVFGGFVGSFISWAGSQVLSLLQIIFEVVAPGAMPYLRRAAGAFRSIVENPIRFVGNLVRAGILGFRQFAGRFLTHLRAALIGWLTGTLGGTGVYIPQAFEIREIIKFVLSVLGLTWTNIRGKLVRVVGETAVAALETGFDVVVTLVREGPAAAWEKIREQLSNLREMVMGQVMSFVRERIVQAAITRLLTSLNPAGAFIQAIIAIYNTIMFLVERLRQIGQVVMSFVDSISAIAAGGIGTAANRVEQTMAGLLTLVISFLARLVGLGNVSDAVKGVVARIRAPIDRVLDRIAEWIGATARRLGRLVAQAGLPADPVQRARLGMQAAVAAVNRFARRRVGRAVLVPLLAAIRTRYGFSLLETFERGGKWWVRGAMSPPTEGPTDAEPEAGAGTAAAGGGQAPANDQLGRLGHPPIRILWHKPPIARYPELKGVLIDITRDLRGDLAPTAQTPIMYATRNAAARERLEPIRRRIREIDKRLLSGRSTMSILGQEAPTTVWHTRAQFVARIEQLEALVRQKAAEAQQALAAVPTTLPEKERKKAEKAAEAIVAAVNTARRNLGFRAEIPQLEDELVAKQALADQTWKELKEAGIYEPKPETLGVLPRWQPGSAQPAVGPRQSRGRTPEQLRFRQVLTEIGFVWGLAEAEHVTEKTIGGPDAFANLWPLAGKNIPPNQMIDTATGTDVMIAPPQGKPEHYNHVFWKDKWFKVEGFQPGV